MAVVVDNTGSEVTRKVSPSEEEITAKVFQKDGASAAEITAAVDTSNKGADVGDIDNGIMNVVAALQAREDLTNNISKARASGDQSSSIRVQPYGSANSGSVVYDMTFEGAGTHQIPDLAHEIIERVQGFSHIRLAMDYLDGQNLEHMEPTVINDLFYAVVDWVFELTKTKLPLFELGTWRRLFWSLDKAKSARNKSITRVEKFMKDRLRDSFESSELPGKFDQMREFIDEFSFVEGREAELEKEKAKLEKRIEADHKAIEYLTKSIEDERREKLARLEAATSAEAFVVVDASTTAVASSTDKASTAATPAIDDTAVTPM
jgi:hypothetical protein